MPLIAAGACLLVYLAYVYYLLDRGLMNPDLRRMFRPFTRGTFLFEYLRRPIFLAVIGVSAYSLGSLGNERPAALLFCLAVSGALLEARLLREQLSSPSESSRWIAASRSVSADLPIILLGAGVAAVGLRRLPPPGSEYAWPIALGAAALCVGYLYRRRQNR